MREGARAGANRMLVLSVFSVAARATLSLAARRVRGGSLRCEQPGGTGRVQAGRLPFCRPEKRPDGRAGTHRKDGPHNEAQKDPLLARIKYLI